MPWLWKTTRNSSNLIVFFRRTFGDKCSFHNYLLAIFLYLLKLLQITSSAGAFWIRANYVWFCAVVKLGGHDKISSIHSHSMKHRRSQNQKQLISSSNFVISFAQHRTFYAIEYLPFDWFNPAAVVWLRINVHRLKSYQSACYINLCRVWPLLLIQF